jgi:hypothetical protein
MNLYEKRLVQTYNHRPNCTMLEYLLLKEELAYKEKMLSNACNEYERLVDDIINCRDIKIDGECFEIREIIEGKK